MRNIYLRLLLAIVLIMVSILAVQTLVILGSTYYVERNWKEDVFDSYVADLEQTLTNVPAFSFNEMLTTLVQIVPDRISGFLIRDELGDMNISIGTSSRGEYIPQLIMDDRRDNPRRHIETSALTLPNTLEISVLTTRKYESENIAPPKYRVELQSISPHGEMLITDFKITPTGMKEPQNVKIPDVINSKDIAGTLLFYNNGMLYGYIDVIVYDMNVYGPVSMVIRSLYGIMLMFMPVAIGITLLCAFIISKHNAEHIRDIQSALNDLSEGKFITGITNRKIKINELRMISESIDKLGHDLERHQQSRKEWLRNISHDLNTPVTSMNILLSGAKDGLFPLDQSLVAALEKENNTLMARIASVSFYSKLMSPDQVLRPETLPIFALVGEIIAGNDDVVLDISPDMVVEADFSLVRRAFQEVFKNAIEYKSEGDVHISCREEDGFAVLDVVNSGKLPVPRPRFFEPWARGDDSRHQGGSGLGLPIVYQIMELHHGTVTIEEVDGVVTVRLRLPIKNS